MIGAVRQKIDVRVDSLQTAMKKKEDNESLSYKSLHKLEKIINSQHSIKMNTLQTIFGNNNDHAGFNSNNVSLLVADLKQLKTEIAKPAMHGVIDKWIDNAQSLLNRKAQALQIIKNLENKEASSLLIHKGSHSWVYKHDNFIIKMQKKVDLASAEHQVAMCNKYSLAHGRDPEAVCQANLILMPLIAGKSEVTPREVKQAVSAMLEKGFYMANPQPSNFVKTPKGEIVPVDFRLVFPHKDLKLVDAKIQKDIAKAYLREGFLYVPMAVKKEYGAKIAQLDGYLGNASPLRSARTSVTARAGLSHI